MNTAPSSSRALLGILLLGFSSGLPLLMVLGNYTFWLAEVGISYTSIGLLSSISLPYTLKFLWAGFFDAVQIPFLGKLLGQRRSWLLCVQVALALALVGMGTTDPSTHLMASALWALSVSFFSASQDIIIDAYRVEQLPDSLQAPGAAMAVNGYRIGTLVSGALGLVMAQWWGWATSYLCIAGLLFLGQFGGLLLTEQPVDGSADLSEMPFRQRFLAPLQSFFGRSHWWKALVLIVLYKLGHSFLEIMSGPFYEAFEYTKTEIATVTKLYGFTATLAGSFAGGFLIARCGLLTGMFVAGVMQCLSPLCYVVLAQVGHSISGLMVTITVDYFFTQMATIALVTYIGALCDRRFTASHYALLTSFSALSRTFFGMFSGWVVQVYDWQTFFITTVFLGMPALLFLMVYKAPSTMTQTA